MNKKITKNFSELEFEVTNTGISNKLPKMYEINRYILASQLQSLRDKLGKPIKITSAYRSYEVNKVVGGASKSRHLYCLAADIVSPSASLHEILGHILADNIGFSRVLVEPTWLHVEVSFSESPSPTLFDSRCVEYDGVVYLLDTDTEVKVMF